MKVDAIVLAGADNNGKLQEVSNERYEALIPIDGKPMITYVIDGLKSSAHIKKILVVGPKELGEFLDPSVTLIPSGQGLAENVQRGIDHLDQERMVLLVTSDIPFLNQEAIDDFIDRCSQLQGDLYYPVVSQEVNDKGYPGSVRTYVHLKEGTFTGGNVILIDPKVMIKLSRIINKVIAMRKKPWQLFSLLGVGFIFKFFTKRLSLGEIEKRAKQLFDVNGVAIVSPCPELGIDVDKPSDLKMAEAYLSKAHTNSREA